jgi:aspartate 1-decarboxylase
MDMLVTLLKSKLHRATVTQSDMHYEGSISIDSELLELSTILPHEQVDVLNITTGARFTTYAISAPSGSRTIGVNGAAARLVQPGDLVIILSYCHVVLDVAAAHRPRVVILGPDNLPIDSQPETHSHGHPREVAEQLLAEGIAR